MEIPVRIWCSGMTDENGNVLRSRETDNSACVLENAVRQIAQNSNHRSRKSRPPNRQFINWEWRKEGNSGTRIWPAFDTDRRRLSVTHRHIIIKSYNHVKWKNYNKKKNDEQSVDTSRVSKFLSIYATRMSKFHQNYKKIPGPPLCRDFDHGTVVHSLTQSINQFFIEKQTNRCYNSIELVNKR